MNLPVIVTPQAEAAVTAAEAWYESKRPGVGVTFRERVEEALDDIADQPGRFTPGARNTRIARVRGYQYLIIFASTATTFWWSPSSTVGAERRTG